MGMPVRRFRAVGPTAARSAKAVVSPGTDRTSLYDICIVLVVRGSAGHHQSAARAPRRGARPFRLSDATIRHFCCTPNVVTILAPHAVHKGGHAQLHGSAAARQRASPPAIPGWYAAGAPLAILWWVRWGGVH